MLFLNTVPTGLLRSVGTQFGNSNVHRFKELAYFTGISTFSDSFYQNYNIAVLALSANVTNISNNAFRECANLHHIILLSETPPVLSSRSFNHNNLFYVPDAALEAYKSASVWSNHSSKIRPISEYRDQRVYDGIILNTMLNTNGTTASSSCRCTTDFIPVAGGDSITFKTPYADSTNQIVYYNSSKGYANYYNNTSRTLTMQTNVRYIRVTFRTAWLDFYSVKNNTTGQYLFKGDEVV